MAPTPTRQVTPPATQSTGRPQSGRRCGPKMCSPVLCEADVGMPKVEKTQSLHDLPKVGRKQTFQDLPKVERTQTFQDLPKVERPKVERTQTLQDLPVVHARPWVHGKWTLEDASMPKKAANEDGNPPRRHSDPFISPMPSEESTGSESEDESDMWQVDRGDLEFEEPVGMGTHAEVFKGTWCGKVVAIKQLTSNRGRTAQVKQEVALLRETSVLTLTSHENLVKFYGSALDQQPYLLVTEFCNGGSCFDLLYEEDCIELVFRQKLKMICDVAGAMSYLHGFRPQIIHRDLKSLNLLLAEPVTCPDDTPNVKVSDFGFCKMRDDGAEWGKMTQSWVGFWMAPEALTGNYDEKVDVYSFAMVMFELLCQEMPFEDLEGDKVLKAAMAGMRPDLEAVPPTTPPDMTTLMEQCWAQKPIERPSFEHICSALDDVISQQLCKA